MNSKLLASILMFMLLLLWPLHTEAQHYHKLFSKEMRETNPSPIYDFLEHALAEQQNPMANRRLRLQLEKVVFMRGSWTTLTQIDPEADQCQISNIEGKRYVVAWSREGNELAALHFPVDYELLANSSLREMERKFVSDLETEGRPEPVEPPYVELGALDKYPNKEVYVLEGQVFPLIKEMTSHIYYSSRVKEERDPEDPRYTYELKVPVILNNPACPGETLANWLLRADPSLPDARLDISFQMSDYTVQNVSTSIGRFATFCERQGCTAYYAFENIYNGNEARVVWLMSNQSAGYVHMAYLGCPLAQLSASKPCLQGCVYLYIPFSNVKDLYSNSPKSRVEKVFK